MHLRSLRSRVSFIALAAGCLMGAPVAASAAPTSVSQLQNEINELQAQVNQMKAAEQELHAQQARLHEEQAATNRMVIEQAGTMKRVAKNNPLGGWYATNDGKPIPDFKNDQGSEFTIFGQVDLDSALASVPNANAPGIHPTNNRGYAGATDFRRIELGLKGVYQYNFPWEIQEDWTKTSSPLAGLLDV